MQDQLEEINETRFDSIFANITQITDKIAPNARNHDIKTEETDMSNPNKTINAIEANYSNGVLKIITDDVDQKIDKEETIKSLEVNNNGNTNISKSYNIEELVYLNKALSTSKLTGIISSPKINQKNKIENITVVSNKSIFGKDEDDSPVNVKKTEMTNKTFSSVDENIETKFLISYINFIKGHITKEEFLQESFPEKSFHSIHEMLIYMKPLNIVRNEFLKELDKSDRDESESEIIGRKDTFFEYADSSDD